MYAGNPKERAPDYRVCDDALVVATFKDRLYGRGFLPRELSWFCGRKIEPPRPVLFATAKASRSARIPSGGVSAR